MREVISEILSAVMIVFIPIVSQLIAKAVKSYGEKQNIEEITTAVAEAVQSTSQTYVDALKEQGSFDKEAQEKARNTAILTVLRILSPAAKKYIESVCDNTEEYLTAKIEAEVRLQKQQCTYITT